MSPAQLSRFRRRLYTLLLAAALTAVCALVLSDSQQIATLFLMPSRPAAALPAPPLERVTDGTAMDGFGSFSPDGRQVLFMRDGQIWLLTVGGQAVRLSGTDTAWDASPVWRPDGKQVAFVRHPLGGTGSAIQVVDPATGEMRELMSEQERIGHLAFAPDGRAIYYTTGRRLMRLELARPGVRQIYLLQENWDMLPGGLAITSDGKAAVLGAGPRIGQSVEYDLWQIPLAATADGKRQARRLTTDGGIMPAVDPQGQRLAFRNPRQDTGIYLMNLKTHESRLVAMDTSDAMYFHPTFTPDGKGLLLSRLNLATRPDQEGVGKFTSSLCLHKLTASPVDAQ